MAQFVPDVVHAHDWQAGLAPAYLHYAGGPRPGTVMTVHNLAFQGEFGGDLLNALGLPWHAYAIDGVEYYGIDRLSEGRACSWPIASPPCRRRMRRRSARRTAGWASMDCCAIVRATSRAS